MKSIERAIIGFLFLTSFNGCKYFGWNKTEGHEATELALHERPDSTMIVKYCVFLEKHLIIPTRFEWYMVFESKDKDFPKEFNNGQKIERLYNIKDLISEEYFEKAPEWFVNYKSDSLYTISSENGRSQQVIIAYDKLSNTVLMAMSSKKDKLKPNAIHRDENEKTIR